MQIASGSFPSTNIARINACESAKELKEFLDKNRPNLTTEEKIIVREKITDFLLAGGNRHARRAAIAQARRK